MMMYEIVKDIDNAIMQHCQAFCEKGDHVRLSLHIKKRFQYYVNSTKTYIVENYYVESEWRDSYDLYYSKSPYRCVPYVTRLHFVQNDIEQLDEIDDDNYLGYITLRPIPVVEYTVSRIRLKYKNDYFNIENETSDKKVFCLSVVTKVNFPHRTIRFSSFPIYAQDAMVSRCAHATLLMVSKYMLKKFNFNNYRLQDLIKNNSILYQQGRNIPSEGLTIAEMVEILKANNYNPISVRFNTGEYIYGKKISVMDYIDSFLESSLPVIIAFQNHVIIVAGHTMNTNEKYYVLVDDSTHHLKNTFKVESHIAAVSLSALKKTFKKKEMDIYIIAPTFDRFYLKFPTLHIIIEMLKKKLLSNFQSGDSVYSENKLKTREILVECSQLKHFLWEMKEYSYTGVKMSHYVWYIEYYLENRLVAYSIVDAGAHAKDFVSSVIKDKSGVSIHRFNTSAPKPLSLLDDIDQRGDTNKLTGFKKT